VIIKSSSLSINDYKNMYKKRAYSKLVNSLSDYIKSDTNSLFHNNLLGMSYLGLKDYESSINIFLKCIDIKEINNDETNLDILFINLAIVYNACNDIKNCLKYYLKAHRANNINLNALENIIDIYFFENDLISTKNYINKALFIDKNNEVAMHRLGLILFKENEFDLAIKNLKSLIKISTNSTIYKYDLANIYLAIEQHKDAENLYLDIIKEKPEFSECYINLGVTYQKIGDLDKSKEYFSEAINLEPDNVISINNLALIHVDQENYQEAQENLEWSLSLDETNYITSNLLAKVHFLTNNYKVCDEYIEKSLLLAPDDIETLILVGSILFSRNLLKEANDIYLKALKLSPDNVNILSNLGHLNTITNSVDLAFKYLNRAIEIDPEHSFSKNILAGIHKTNNDYATAKELYLESKEPNWEENVLECLYLEENFYDFKEFLLKNSDKLIESRTASALINHANYCLNEHYEHHFCNDQLSYIKTIKCHKNHGIDNLNSDLLNEINNYSYDLKKQLFIKNGVQSLGNLFSLEIDAFKNFKNLILKEYDKYFTSFENSRDIFINKHPKKPKLMGWFVKISKNGFIQPHNHVGAWLSGVYYLTCLDSSSDEGSIEFGFSDTKLPFQEKTLPNKIVRPQESMMVLFPSQIYHRSLPFKKDIERICLAFDFLP
jgi:tetratricopeptide (TPR) repeat protein